MGNNGEMIDDLLRGIFIIDEIHLRDILENIFGFSVGEITDSILIVWILVNVLVGFAIIYILKIMKGLLYFIKDKV